MAGMRILPDIIVVLGGGLKKEGSKWRTTRFNEGGDSFGALGDRLRVVAAACLYKDISIANPDLLIVVCGGKGQLANIADVPYPSEVIRDELVELGIPKDKIIEEKKSGKTHEQLKELNKLISEKGWQKLAVISNEYHLPRVKAMIKYVKEISNLRELLSKNMLILYSAEKILLKDDRANWEKIIQEAYRSGFMKQRMAIERQGVKQIKLGIYKFS